MIANQVDADDPRIERRPASSLKDDTDLGDIPVTVRVPPLSPALVDAALESGLAHARRLLDAGLIEAAALMCQGRVRMLGFDALQMNVLEKILETTEMQKP